MGRRDMGAKLGQAIALLAVGLGIGWLAGLSTAPVISAVLASLLGIAGGIVSGLKTVSPKKPGNVGARQSQSLDAVPSALVVFGIALGATAGTWTRTHQLLAPASVREALTDSVSEGPNVQPAVVGVLYNVTESDCAELRLAANSPNEQTLRNQLRSFGDPWPTIEEQIHERGTLEVVVRALCTND